MIFDFFKQFLPNPYYTGVNPDYRSSDEKKRDWLHEERVLAAVSDPFSNAQVLQSPFFYENQQQTSSCVPHGVGLGLAIERKADANTYQRLAQIFPYRLRSNYPGEGAYLQEVFDIYRHQGAPLYTTLPTPYLESQANAITLTQAEYNEAAIFKGKNYFTITTNSNINTLASVAQQGHGVPILIYGTQNEWGRDYPEIQNPNLQLTPYTEIRHCVCILPNSGFTLNGKKYVTIQDSAWFGGKQLRHLSEDWIKARCYGAAYWDTVGIIGTGPKPTYRFTQTLKYGMKSNEVTQMQKLLIYEGLLPSDCATGYFGGLTLAGVHAFQSKYASEILTPIGLDKPTDIWGSMCIQKANKLTSQP